MVIRYRSLDTEDTSDTQGPTPLDLMQQNHPMLEGNTDSSDEYCKETDNHCPLADLLEQFQ